MTEEEAIERMKKLSDSDDTEYAHMDADQILCDFLWDLGYEELVKAYSEVDKWFA